ncbi:MAG: glycosyltransferase family 39 protein [Aggregatilineales bacterium]
MTKALFLRFILAVQVSVLLLLCLVFLSLTDLPVSDDEGLALWVVEDSAQMWDVAPRDSLRGIRANVGDMLERLPETNTPPLYFVILDGWVMLFGDSLLAVRMLSVLCVSLALPAIVHIIRRYMPAFPITPAFAIALLLALPILLVVNFYGLLLFFASASLWLLLRWEKNQRGYEAFFYVIFLTGALLTAHVALPMLILHGVIAWRRDVLRRWVIFAAISLAFLLPALVVFPPVLFDLMSWRNLLIPIFVAAVTVTVPVLAVVLTENIKANQLVVNFALAVYVIGGALLLWRNPNWQAEISAINALRQPTDPAIMAIDPRSGLGYLDRQPETRLSHGISVDVGWRTFTRDELDAIVETMDDAPSIWVFLPDDRSETDFVLEALEQIHTVGYSEILDEMVFRRYDKREE